MKTYIDTNILLYYYQKRGHQVALANIYTTSINALEFLKNTETQHTNRAKYYIPYSDPWKYYIRLLRLANLYKTSKHPIGKNLSDHIIFNFARDYESYVLYNNESIAQAINEQYIELFNLSISFLKKGEYKDLKKRFRFLLSNNFKCDIINSNDILLAYELLDLFAKKYALEKKL